jgi:flavoprotein
VTVDASSELASANGLVISAASLASPMAKLSTLPTVFALDQNYPNPFNPSTQIEYSLPKSGRVTLTIYNIMGQQVAKLVDGIQEAGVYNVQWNASNLASGMYIYRINVDHENGNFTASKRLMLLK